MARQVRTTRRAAVIGGALALGLGFQAGHAAERGPVKIGVLGDLSSAYSNVGGRHLVEAVKMAVEDFGGSVLGQPIEILSADTQLKPDVASTTARRWFDEGVDVLVDIPSTNMTFAVTPLAEDRKRVVLATSAASSDITGAKCSPVVAHWTYDTYANARSAGAVLLEQGAKNWFILNQDTATGVGVERDITELVTQKGGKIVGSVKAPLETTDFSSYLLRAQSAKPDIIAFAPAGAAGVNAIKQANEFGLKQGGTRFVSVFMMPDDVKSLGLEAAQGLIYATAFDASLNEQTKAFAERFRQRAGKVPNMNMVGSYSAVLHYLKAVQAVGTTNSDKVMPKMREMPVRDVFTQDGELRIDGRMAHSMFVMQVKSPAESKDEWDLAKVIATVPASVAVRPLNAGGCPLVK
ncbi:ABC transporter substrate-binding protein [Enterovirga aerilata]|uniref:ABC transporter substrate-binding protein n=1 Tax=Enterovirga aerilata TaxID=2730920 RepID=A0A849IJK7_9HYPH|nr:ABC transporter substrate-binding protein [Enterovirga sp. DB1703]NNM74123.1 ABC transporter substrate-binding protein [Enterovirga sp. DB1703]